MGQTKIMESFRLKTVDHFVSRDVMYLGPISGRQHSTKARTRRISDKDSPRARGYEGIVT